MEPGDYLAVVPMTQGDNGDTFMRTLGLPLPNLPAGSGVGAATFSVRVDSSGGG